MSAKLRKDLSDASQKTYAAGPWFVRVNRTTRQCQVTSGDCWFSVPRSEAAQVILRKVG